VKASKDNDLLIIVGPQKIQIERDLGNNHRQQQEGGSPTGIDHPLALGGGFPRGGLAETQAWKLQSSRQGVQKRRDCKLIISREPSQVWLRPLGIRLIAAGVLPRQSSMEGVYRPASVGTDGQRAVHRPGSYGVNQQARIFIRKPQV